MQGHLFIPQKVLRFGKTLFLNGLEFKLFRRDVLEFFFFFLQAERNERLVKKRAGLSGLITSLNLARQNEGAVAIMFLLVQIWWTKTLVQLS
jgi:hypothetical protein